MNIYGEDWNVCMATRLNLIAKSPWELRRGSARAPCSSASYKAARAYTDVDQSFYRTVNVVRGGTVEASARSGHANNTSSNLSNGRTCQ